jgi:hypothetical protein
VTIEQRYRRALAWYPREWRTANEDVVVGTLLDEADAEGRSRPSAGQLTSLFIHAARNRLGVSGGILGRGIRDRVAALALAAGLASALAMFVGYEWAPWVDPAYYRGWGGAGPFRSLAVLIPLLWMVAAALAALRRSTGAAIALAVTLPVTVACIVLVEQSPLIQARPPATYLTFLALLACLALAGRPARVDRRVLVQLCVGAVLFTAASLGALMAMNGSDAGRYPIQVPGFFAAGYWWLVACAGAVVLAARRSSWSVPAFVLAACFALYSISYHATQSSSLDEALGTAAYALVLGGAAILVAVFASGFRIRLVRPER